jgi:cell division protein FtsN
VEKSKTIVPPKSAPVANNETPKIEEKPKTVVSPKPLAVKENTKTEMKPPVSNNIYINEERSNKGWLIPVIAFVILLVAAIVLWFFTDVLDKYKSKPAPPPPPPIEQIVEEEEIEIVEEPEIVETPIIATRQHHIIVGSFKEEANARELKNKIAEQGFSSSSVFEHKGMFLVSAEWHQAVSVALQRQEEMLNTNKLENWVLSISVK